MQKEAIHFLTTDGFAAYYRHFDQMFTLFVNLWQIFWRLLTANKYPRPQIICRTEYLNRKNICRKTKIRLQLLHHHTCLSILLCITLWKSGLYWATPPGKMFRHRKGWFSQQRIEWFSQNGKTCRIPQIPHVSVDWKIDLQVEECWTLRSGLAAVWLFRGNNPAEASWRGCRATPAALPRILWSPSGGEDVSWEK